MATKWRSVLDNLQSLLDAEPNYQLEALTEIHLLLLCHLKPLVLQLPYKSIPELSIGPRTVQKQAYSDTNILHDELTH